MKDIKGYEGLYAITSCGRVWSYRGKKFLKPRECGGGYFSVILYKNNTPTVQLIHRLVAEAYIPNPNGLPQVNHRDEIKSRNQINNLEWCDSKYNMNYGTRTDRVKQKLYKKVQCVETGQIFNSFQEAADWAGVQPSTLSTYFLRERKTCAGYHWIKIN